MDEGKLSTTNTKNLSNAYTEFVYRGDDLRDIRNTTRTILTYLMRSDLPEGGIKKEVSPSNHSMTDQFYNLAEDMKNDCNEIRETLAKISQEIGL